MNDAATIEQQQETVKALRTASRRARGLYLMTRSTAAYARYCEAHARCEAASDALIAAMNDDLEEAA